MVSIIIATHGKLAEGLLDSLELITGMKDNIRTLSLERSMDVTEYGRILSDTVKEMDDLSGVIVFTDLFLASPYNQAVLGYRNIGKDDKYYVVSGVNLPMLIEAVDLRAMGKDISEIVAEAVENGKEGIHNFMGEYGQSLSVS